MPENDAGTTVRAMNSKILLRLGALLVLLSSAASPLRAELSLGELRAKFEGALGDEGKEHTARLGNLQEGYLEALERLKTTLGREGKLEQAARVLAESEAVEEGWELAPLPTNADYRLKSLRTKLKRAYTDAVEDHHARVAGLATIYLAELDERKRALTRAGKIRIALLVEEEIHRAREQPEIKQVLEPKESAEKDEGDLALHSKGAKAGGAEDARYLIDGKTDNYERGRYAWAKLPCSMLVTLKEVALLDRVRILLYDSDERSYQYEVKVSADGKAWLPLGASGRGGASGWQDLRFAPVKAQFIRIDGLGNTANNRFHVVEVEAYAVGN